MKKTIIASMAAITALTAVPVTTSAAWAHGRGHHRGHDRGHHDRDHHYRTTDNGIRYWRGDDGRYYCRRSNGTVGLLVGAALGALVGRSIDTRGERVTGTVLGAAAGALIGNKLAEGPTRCR